MDENPTERVVLCLDKKVLSPLQDITVTEWKFRVLGLQQKMLSPFSLLVLVTFNNVSANLTELERCTIYHVFQLMRLVNLCARKPVLNRLAEREAEVGQMHKGPGIL